MKVLFSVFLLSVMAIFAQPLSLSQLVYQIRDPSTDSADFREALEKIGEYLALDLLEELETNEITIQTLTGAEATHILVSETPVLVTILRGGLPLNAGVHRVFPRADVGFLAMARNEETLQPEVSYVALPDMKGKSVIISDTMLATGGSLLDALRIVEQREPKNIFVVVAMASKPGITRILSYNPTVKIFAAAVDPELNEKGFIIPGLGDAGDRAYGKKSSK